jgi:aspartate aminotransferase-like enzyme
MGVQPKGELQSALAKKQLIMLPGPTNVPDRILKAMARPMINHRGPEFRELLNGISSKVQYTFQTRNDALVLSSSGTGGVEAAFRNIISPGDKVLVPVFGIFSQRMKEIVEVCGGVPVELQSEWGSGPTPDQVREEIERENVKAVGLVYNETSTGTTIKGLRDISRIAKENGALMIVDAISILGGDECPVDDWKIDICITGSQKCLAAPPGVALVSVSQDAWNVVKKTKIGSVYFNFLKMKESLEKGETPFTPAIPIFYALDEALDMLQEEGLENRIKRHALCAEAFYSGLPALGLELFTQKAFRSNMVIAVKNPQGLDDKVLLNNLRRKYRVIISGGMGKLKGSTYRIGNMGSITPDEVIATIGCMGSALIDAGIKADIGAGISAAREKLMGYQVGQYP